MSQRLYIPGYPTFASGSGVQPGFKAGGPGSGGTTQQVISGYIVDSGDTGIEGVEITLTQHAQAQFLGFDEDTLGGVVGTGSNWVHGANHVVTEVIQAISSDQGSHTPSQATKQVFHAATSQASEFICPCGTLPRTGKVRVALLARGYDATYRQWGFGTLADGVGNYLLDDMWNGILDLGGNPDTMDSYHRTGGADIAYVSPPTVNAGVNNTANRWVWQRVEFDYDASEINMHTYQPAGGLTGTVRTAAFPTGFENNVFTKVYCRHGTHALYGNVAVAGIWIGNGNDAWPEA